MTDAEQLARQIHNELFPHGDFLSDGAFVKFVGAVDRALRSERAKVWEEAAKILRSECVCPEPKPREEYLQRTVEQCKFDHCADQFRAKAEAERKSE